MANLIEVAKKIMLSDRKYNRIDFNELWKLVVQETKLSKEEDNKYISDFYFDLLENPDFIRTNNDLWTLRQLITFDEYNQISKSLFNNTLLDDNVEENYKEFISDIEMKEINKANKKDNITDSIDLEEDDSDEDLSSSDHDEDDDGEEDDYE